jgi:hypothetical protein
MKLTQRTQFYIVINVCLIVACVVFASFYDKATKKFKTIDKNDKDYESVQHARKLWGWLAVAMFIIICIVNWRTFLFCLMIAVTLFLGNDAPDLTGAAAPLLLANDLSSGPSGPSKKYQTVKQ